MMPHARDEASGTAVAGGVADGRLGQAASHLTDTGVTIDTITDDGLSADALSFASTRERGRQAHDLHQHPVNVGGRPTSHATTTPSGTPTTRAAEHAPEHAPLAALDPSHAVRSRLIDPAHPHCSLGTSTSLFSSTAPSAAITAVFELVVHFETFKNVDLFRQGLYCLRANFFTLAAKQKVKVASATSQSTSGGVSGVNIGTTIDHSSEPQHATAYSHPHGATSGGYRSSLQAQILQWENNVHELNTPPVKKKDEKKDDSTPPPPRTTETVLASTEGDAQLRKHKVALPYNILHTPTEDDEAVFAFSDKAVYPASIEDSSMHFLSRTFRIQYCEQEVMLNDACLFRLELNLRRRVPVYLEIELLFAEYTIADAARERPPPHLDTFTVASRHLYCLEDLYTSGVHAFVPVVFDDYHFASVDTMVHSQLIDIKFRQAANQQATAAAMTDMSTDNSPTPEASTPAGSSTSTASSSPPTPTSSLSSTTDFASDLTTASSARSSPKLSPATATPTVLATTAAAAVAPPLRPTFPTHSLAQVLFPRMMHPTPNRIQTNPASMMQLANDYHQLFLTTLIHAYNQLATTFVRYNRHCLTALQRNSLGDAIEVAPLLLPTAVSPIPTQPQGSTSGGSSVVGGVRHSTSAEFTSDSSSRLRRQDSQEPTSLSRRSSLEPPQRLQSEAAELEELQARFPLPPLYTLSYRLRTAGACCVWESPDLAADLLLSDLQSVVQQIFTLWHHFQHAITHCVSEVVKRERQTWNKARVATWNNFVFKERYHFEDRLRVGHANIANMHGRTAHQLRTTGALIRLCHPAPPVRDCTPTLQPNEQVLLFEEQFQFHNDDAEDSVVRSKSFEIIDSHFIEDAAAAAISTTDVPVDFKRLIDDTTASEESDESSHTGPLSDHIADPDMAAQRRESDIIPSSLLVDPPVSPQGGLDFDAVSRRLVEASAARRQSAVTRGYEGKHLIIFVHGYQGTSWDMRLFRNHVALMQPHTQVYSSSANENQTEGDIGDMGRRLAAELYEFITESCKDLGRLSFVCHSLGGIITRSALTESIMEPFLPKLYSYTSLATPHCGYLFSENSMLNTGIWFLQRWTKSQCLSQLSLSDAEDMHDCFLYKLAKKPSLTHFKHVFLLASQQDKYAPFHSARIEVHPQALVDRKKGAVFHGMVSSLLGLLSPDVQLRRCDMWYKPTKRSLDSFIGRTAHINFLTHSNYMILMNQLYPELFT